MPAPAAARVNGVNPLLLAVLLAAVVSAFCWVASLITRTTSWVDMLWSIVPVAYVWVFAGWAGLTDARLDVMAVLVTAWGARLTYNFGRKGGYAGVEDYRWAVLRARMPAWQFQILNLVFIVLIQNAVILAMTLPAWTAYEHRATAFGPWDTFIALAFLACLGGETLADEQQWDFHTAKHTGGPDFQPRFLTSGLWRFSRHPNYFFEQAQWWVLFCFGAAAAGSVLQWTVAGAAALTILFIGSTIFTESITKAKYPEYADYQRRVSAVIPWFPRRAA